MIKLTFRTFPSHAMTSWAVMCWEVKGLIHKTIRNLDRGCEYYRPLQINFLFPIHALPASPKPESGLSPLFLLWCHRSCIHTSVIHVFLGNMVSLLLNVVIFDQCCSGTLLPWIMFELDELVVLFVLYCSVLPVLSCSEVVQALISCNLEPCQRILRDHCMHKEAYLPTILEFLG